MKQDVNIGKMIKDELDRQERTPAWLAKRLNTCRSNGYKVVNEKKFNDILFLIDVSIAVNHNFFKDIAEIMDSELSTDQGQDG